MSRKSGRRLQPAENTETKSGARGRKGRKGRKRRKRGERRRRGVAMARDDQKIESKAGLGVVGGEQAKYAATLAFPRGVEGVFLL
jgi:hypothetical protein